MIIEKLIVRLLLSENFDDCFINVQILFYPEYNYDLEVKGKSGEKLHYILNIKNIYQFWAYEWHIMNVIIINRIVCSYEYIV